MSNDIHQILAETKHRSWPLPNKPFTYIQDWNDALFFHWKVDIKSIENLLPKGLEVHTFDGEAWISIVAFTMNNLQFRNGFPLSFISNFDEINIRTYVIKDGIAGVYFLSIDVNNKLASFIANKLSNLPFKFGNMRRNYKNAFQQIAPTKEIQFSARYQIGKTLTDKTALDEFLTEKYSVYMNIGKQLYRYDVHHLPWKLNKLWISELVTNYQIANISLQHLPHKMHYSPGVKVLAWKKVKV